MQNEKEEADQTTNMQEDKDSSLLLFDESDDPWPDNAISLEELDKIDEAIKEKQKLKFLIENVPDDIWKLIFNLVPFSQVLTSLRRSCKRFLSLIDSNDFILQYRAEYSRSLKIQKMAHNPEHTNYGKMISDAKMFDRRIELKELLEPKILFEKLPGIHDGQSIACAYSNRLLVHMFDHNEGCKSSISICLAYVMLVYATNSRMTSWEKFKCVFGIAKYVIKANVFKRIDMCDFICMILLNLNESVPELYAKMILRTVMQLIENPFLLPSSPSSSSSSSSSNTPHLTEEQEQIVKYSMRNGEVVQVRAFAGTGKTTTLIEYAKAHSSKKILYISFNKSVQEEASKRFPQNTTCRTWHSLAYQSFCEQFDVKKGDMTIQPSLKHKDVKEILKINSDYVIHSISCTFLNFLQSSAGAVELSHVPESYEDVHLRSFKFTRKRVVKETQRLFELLKEFKEKGYPITYDFFFKLYQLSNTPIAGFDIIMVDEAQDSSGAQSSVLQNQVGRTSIMLVGDPHQQIYAFRGAVNSMQKIPAHKTFYLTLSFRFGYEIATAANQVLSLKKEKGLLIGVQPQSRINYPQLHFNGRYTFLARCNASLAMEALRLLDSGVTMNFVGGLETYDDSLIREVFYLFTNQRGFIKNSYILKMKDFSALKTSLQNIPRFDLRKAVSLVDRFGLDTLEKLNELNGKIACENADVTFSTVHKAKGCEWDVVELCNDFNLPIRFDEAEIKKMDEEINILYVAITRAKRELRIDGSVRQFLYQFGGIPTERNLITSENVEEIFPHSALISRPCSEGEVQVLPSSQSNHEVYCQDISNQEIQRQRARVDEIGADEERPRKKRKQ